MWELVYFALVENLLLESRHKTNVMVLVRFIDDMFIIWKKNKQQPNIWRDFKMCFNHASNLNRFCEDLGEKIISLDLEAWIGRGE